MEVVCLEIHQTRKFAKRMAYMAKAGKHERIVAERARQIIADLQTNPLHEEAECKRTRHGELRLNDCRKYDLSCGFRLISLKRDKRLIFTYIGSHDDCQRWIENNRDYQDEIESVTVPPIGAEEQRQSEAVIGTEPDHDEYEERLRGEIDERVLREIFSGLCNNG
jgi:mRNA-degrading endonuclease YafQ of YafQ-DinJ toxin-antitoxin module